MGLRRPKMNIEDNNCHTYTETLIGKYPPSYSSSLHLKVSRIMVNRTSFPSKGTTREVGGMISASRRKNTVRERRMLMERLTCNTERTVTGCTV